MSYAAICSSSSTGTDHGCTTRLRFALLLSAACVFRIQASAAEPTTRIEGRITNASTDRPLEARVYVQSSDGQWFFPRSAASDGTAVEYHKQRPPASVEMHTTLSAHPFLLDLPPGTYTISVERGKEYIPARQEIVVTDQPSTLRIKLRRWIDLAQRGWYSGDTHVHRSLDELPNVMLAEDLNVALPLSYWVTSAHTSPQTGDKSTRQAPRPEPIQVDRTHVIYPVNTEYEIFSVGGRPHTLGALFLLGHRSPIDQGVPPVGPVAERARREGAILDLDKHSWPWSLMLVPVLKVDLFELANNHVWRTEFGLPGWTLEAVPEYMQLERDAQGLTEWGWIDFGFQTYYALLNCGFRIRPSGGTASGVHPVPLGFGRVYVQLPDGFGYDRWMDGLRQGRSFVTTGPMLFVEVNGKQPGHVFEHAAGHAPYHIRGVAESAVPLDRIEILTDGRIARTIVPDNEPTPARGYRSPIDETIELEGSGWIALRAFERRDDHRVRFAHTSPVHIEVPGQKVRPRREEIDYLIGRVRGELERNQDVLPPDALDEYREALRVYEAIRRGRGAITW